METKTKVIYRKFSDGEIIALFPQIAANVTGWFCSSYMHVGQHGAADTNVVVRQTVLAKPKEYAKLHKELKQLGYNLQIAKKCTTKDWNIRKTYK